MNFVIAAVFDNYINAHVTMGRLQEEHINCWLKDENTVTIDPILTNAVGGIKLMVAEPQIERALALIATDRQEYQQQHPCPQCGSENIDLVSTPRKPGNWLGIITSAVLGIGSATPIDKVYHCFDCGKEYEME
ncbi:putative signal transducing protein [Niabella sp. 22666]|uniref:putative signal transducing protein n=1 Tax=Niabella sp. 22666 TaxID=3453954 RepID=UPI003F879011